MNEPWIAAGAFLLQQFHWVIYVFGALLVFTGVRMAVQDEHQLDLESNPAIRLVCRVVPITAQYEGQRFFVRQQVAGKMRLAATPLFVVLALVETTDLIFALDSIPPFSQSHRTRSLSTARTCSRFSACAPCTSCWRT